MTTYIDRLARLIRDAVPPQALPQDDTHQLFRSYAVLLLAKGNRATLTDVHNAWAVWMAERDPNHSSLIPFDQLPADVAQADEPFLAAIHEVAKTHGPTVGLATDFDKNLFPNGLPQTEKDHSQLLELYKLMVNSSEALVGRRQGVNTFFLTINGALLTAIGVVLGQHPDRRLKAMALVVLAFNGIVLSQAWRSLIRSFGQLNTGKFAVINRIEELFPAAIYLAEWKALAEGKKPRIYKTFTSREVWAPWTMFITYSVTIVGSLLVSAGYWSP